jgi:hypothetical protein
MIETANREIFERAQADSKYKGMRTTAVVLVVAGEGAFLGHVGDSRGYLLRGGEVYRLTEDHTWANDLAKSHAIAPEEARGHPYASVLSRSLGAAPHLEVDAACFQVEPFDRFVLCSDGVHSYLRGQDILSYSMKSASPEELVRKLVREARSQGGADNISAVVVEPEAGSDQPRNTLALQQEIKLLKGMFLFEQLTPQEVLRMMRIMYRVRKKAGTAIIHEGVEGGELFIVLEGEVDVTLRKAHLTTIGAGGHFGEFALIDNEVRAATVTAKTDVALLTVKHDDFNNLLRTDPRLASKLLWSFLRVVAGNMRSLSKSFVNLSSQANADAGATIVDWPAAPRSE